MAATGKRLDGKRALITGGSRGIGRAIVEAFVAEGARVLTCGRSSALPDLPPGVAWHSADLSDRQHAEELVAVTQAQLGRVDILVNNAGVQIEKTVVATSPSGLLLSDLQDSWRDPSRIILGHPFNPPHLVPLVELLGNERTVPGALDFAQAFYEGCGKVTIRVNKEVPGHVANRLQAALWREAIDLVLQGVASVEDVDKAVTAGPGLRWSVMGPHMLFSLGSGGAGMEGFCARYGESFHRWWDSMNAPRLDEEAGRILSAGVAKEERGRSFAGLAVERDRKLIVAQRALS